MWVIVSDPDNEPADGGLKATETTQLLPGAMLVPEAQVVEEITNLPVTVVAPNTSAAVPVLLSVTDCAVDVTPTFVDGNASKEVDSVAVGVPTTTATPVPESATVLVVGVAL